MGFQQKVSSTKAALHSMSAVSITDSNGSRLADWTAHQDYMEDFTGIIQLLSAHSSESFLYAPSALLITPRTLAPQGKKDPGSSLWCTLPA